MPREVRNGAKKAEAVSTHRDSDTAQSLRSSSFLHSGERRSEMSSG